MFWAPSLLKNTISLFVESSTETELTQNKIVKFNENLSKIQRKIISNEITDRELECCVRLVNESNALINSSLFQKCPAEIKNLSSLFDRIKQISLPSNGAATIESTQITPTPEPALNYVFYCDIDHPDHNGALSESIRLAIGSKIPFITSKALVCNSNILPDRMSWGSYSTIMDTYREWNILKKNEFLIFIPKSYPCKLEDLGFDLSAMQALATPSEIFEGPSGNPTIDDFFSLFKSKVKNKIVLHGHGGAGSILGGLSIENYHKFLQFVEPACESLELHSCHAGSLNALENYLRNGKEQKSPSFPIFMRSIGSFDVILTDMDRSYAENFKIVDQCIEEKGTMTIPKLKKMFGDLAKTKCISEPYTNFMQVKFPAKTMANSGFRPLGEDENAYIITFLDLQKAKLEKIEKMVICNKSYLEILPLEIDVPLHVSNSPSPYTIVTIDDNDKKTLKDIGESIKLLSVIPGDAHHLIHHLKLEGAKLFDLFVTNAKVYADCSAHKAFYIGKVETEQGIYSKVVLDYDKTMANLYTAEGEPEVYAHYKFDLKKKVMTKRSLNKDEYCFEVLQAARQSNAKTEALKSSCGGHETEDGFWNSLLNNVFWNGDDSLPQDYIQYDKYKKKELSIEALCASINSTSHYPLVVEALENEDTDLALHLLSLGSIYVNKKNGDGRTLLSIAILHKNEKLIRHLIDSGADINLAAQEGKTPLMLAVRSGDVKLVELILDRSNMIDFDIKDAKGWTTLSRCYHSIEVFKLIYDAIKRQLIHKNKLEGDALEVALKQKLNHLPDEGLTLIGAFSFFKNKQNTQELLDLGADPYIGKPSAISIAISQRDKEMVEFWLEKNIDVGKVDNYYMSPFDYTCVKGTPEILKLLLKKIDLSKYPKASELLASTLKKGKAIANAKLLFDAGVKVDLNNFDPRRPAAWTFMEALFKYDDIDLLDKVLKQGHRVENVEFDEYLKGIFDYCVFKSVELGERFLTLFGNQINLFYEKNSSSFSIARKGDTFLSLAYKYKRPQWVELLLKNGADPTLAAPDGEPSFVQMLIDKRDESTLDLCLKIPSFWTFLLKSKPDWFEYCLKRACLEKNGANFPAKEILEVIMSGKVANENLKLLKEFGFGLGHPEILHFIDEVIRLKQERG